MVLRFIRFVNDEANVRQQLKLRKRKSVNGGIWRGNGDWGGGEVMKVRDEGRRAMRNWAMGDGAMGAKRKEKGERRKEKGERI